MLMAICHSADAGWAKVEDLDSLSELRQQSGNVLWAEADVANLTKADVETIAEEFGLHELAVEDAMHARQRPKIENYEGHHFVVFHQLDEVEEQLEAAQIACFVGERYVVTIHSGADRTIEAAKKRWARASEETDRSSALLHTLFDVVVDEYQSIADALEQTIEDLEEIALETPNAGLQKQLYRVKQKVSRIRRYVFPLARVLEWTSESDDSNVAEDHLPRFRDVHDHLLRITDQVRNIDDLAQAVIDLTHSEQANLLNQVSKRLSGYAAIFAALTLIAGIYGMNFELVPEDQTLFGFWFAIALMVVTGAGLYGYFKKRGWL